MVKETKTKTRCSRTQSVITIPDRGPVERYQNIQEQQISRPRWHVLWTKQELWSGNSSLGTTYDEQYIEVESASHPQLRKRLQYLRAIHSQKKRNKSRSNFIHDTNELIESPSTRRIEL